MSERKVRFGLIGYGLFGAHHANAIASCDDTELAAIAVRSEASQSAARGTHGTADVYGDYRAMLDAGIVESITDHTDLHTYFRGPNGLNVHRCYGYMANVQVGQVICDWLGRD